MTWCSYLELTSPYQEKLEFIKNPMVAEFLGMAHIRML